MKGNKILAGLMVFLLVCGNARAVNPGPGDYPWSTDACRHPNDKPIKEVYPKGMFFFTLGPTGIKARIYEETPTHLLVTFVFQDEKSPARGGKVSKGDVIVGAGGKTFNTPHKFGRRGGKAGWDGPLMDLAAAIENAQGSDGALKLMVWRGGNKSSQETVTLQLEQKGKFAATYPWNCPRSEKMLAELCEVMVQEIDAGRGGAIHSRSHMLLALMASGIDKYESYAKDKMKGMGNKSYAHNKGGFMTWTWGFDGVLLGEYYNRYKDEYYNRHGKGKHYIPPAIASLESMYLNGMWYRGGSFSHRSALMILRSGAKPYASIAGISGLAMTAMSLFKAAELPYSEEAYQVIHKCYLNSGSDDGAGIAYGFGGGLSVEVHPTDMEKAKSPSGRGFIVPGGMAALGEYKITYPAKGLGGGHDWIWGEHVKDAKRAGKEMFYWVEAERDSNIVFQKTDWTWVIVRKWVGRSEPTGPYNTTGRAMHPLPSGLGAAAHMIGARVSGQKSWEYYGKHAANTCANSYMHVFSGHGGGQLHGFWTVVGVSWADKDKQRIFLDYLKSFLILSQTHTGEMIVQPWNRDRPGGNGDPFYGSRSLPTATAAMLLALPRKRLMIIGAGDGAAPVASSSSVSSAPSAVVKQTPQARKARTLSRDNKERLDKSLLSVLATLGSAGALKPLPLNISITKARVSLVSVDKEGLLTFMVVGGKQTADIKYSELKDVDYATLALLAAALKPESNDIHAIAGVYMESLGNVSQADLYFEKAGEPSSKKLSKLFD